ncbi:VOC family protein [Mesorhizobium sp. WSM3862]|uniref:VOC family protein n=1 Tax=Mesorhizobium sp. WSM3862 TaxID=632858 RepID=UPI000BAF818D|nr:VOC family protein [Mesorhizobium sp. WSM3862]PBB99517.1 hypothetical protein CK224_08250 [Mesorhizobium sp. WSM3862]
MAASKQELLERAWRATDAGWAKQQPGGWNRILIYVEDMEGRVQALKAAGLPLRNAVETGPGGSQIIIDDPDGNPIELHQPPK